MNSLRKLAKHLDLSHVTVSAALRGLPGVKADTRERVLRAAEQHGYHINPLASAVMASMRRVENKVFRGVLVLLRPEVPRAMHDPEERERRRIASGAAHKARELGFDLQEIQVGCNGNDLEKLHDILLARGVLGLVMLVPPGERETWRRIDRGLIPCVCTGRRATGLDFVGPDHEAAMALALRHMHARGCRRVGLALPRDGAKERHRAWIAGIYADRLSEAVATSDDGVPSVFLYDKSDENAFLGWLEAGSHDAVIADAELPLPWQSRLRASLRDADGVCFLNLHAPCERGPGVDLRWEDVGMKSVELLAERILLRRTDRAVHVSTTTATLCQPGWLTAVESARLVA